MSEFKFSCPNCQQNIQATSEYSGLQINCPSCQTPLVVPASPDSPAPPPVPSGPRLSKAPSTPQAQPSAAAAATFYAEKKPIKRKKPKTGLIVGISLGVIAAVAAIYFWPELMKKVTHANETAVTDQATNNTPPPPPPELSTDEILQKVSDTYKGLTDYAAKAQTLCTIDMSALVPGQKPIFTSTTSTLQLGRTDHFRLEWEQSVSGQKIKGAAWNAGKGNFVGYGPTRPSKVKTRELALAPSQQIFFLLSSGIADLFFSDTNSFATDTNNFTKTNSPDLNAQDNYVLTGQANHQSVLLWIKKSNFMITQIKVILGGAMDEAELKKLPSAQRAQMMALSKLKGNITETYDSIQVNQNLMASSFESSYRPSANPNAGRAQRPGGSMAGQLTQPGSRRRPPQ